MRQCTATAASLPITASSRIKPTPVPAYSSGVAKESWPSCQLYFCMPWTTIVDGPLLRVKGLCRLCRRQPDIFETLRQNIAVCYLPVRIWIPRHCYQGMHNIYVVLIFRSSRWPWFRQLLGAYIRCDNIRFTPLAKVRSTLPVQHTC